MPEDTRAGLQTTLTSAQEAIAVALRRSLLQLDNLLSMLRDACRISTPSSFAT